MFGVTGSTYARLWQVWLEADPTYTRMRSFLARIDCLAIDFATEKFGVDVQNILPAFLEFSGASLCRPNPDSTISLSECHAHVRLTPNLGRPYTILD